MARIDVTLQHSQVNSNTAVYVQGTNVTYAANNTSKATPVEGKYDSVEVDVLGFGPNPLIIVEGALDVEDNPSNTMTHSLLLDFKQCRTAITLTVGAGTTPIYLKGRPTAGYSIGGTYLDSLSVIMTGFKIQFDPTFSKDGKVWKYSATFMETV